MPDSLPSLTPPIADLLTLDQLDAGQLSIIARRAAVLSGHWASRTMPKSLAGRRIGLITDLPGWRNPTALMLGATEMGATCVPVTTSLNGPECIADIAGYLDNWFDCLAVRTPSLDRLTQFAEHLSAPVINLRTNDNHPCEILGDLSFALSHRGSWDGLHVTVVAPAGNILQSWIEAALVLPIRVTQISHPSLFAQSGPVRFATDTGLAPLQDADIIITDCWPDKSGPVVIRHLETLRITADILDRCRPDALFLPCPPVTRSHEVDESAMSHTLCQATAAKAFLLHTQNAVLERLTDNT